MLCAYIKYAQVLKLGAEIVYESESSWSLCVTGEEAWQKFAGEAGKHVVQRVPQSETRGRRHTSVVAVSVLPLYKESSSNGNALPFLIASGDVEIITQRGHGKGGQHQNKVESAVRAIHKPSGIAVFINGRDQYRNKQLALEILSARVKEMEDEKRHAGVAKIKAEQIGSGSRSGKIRTYNFISSVVIDHRTGVKCGRLDAVMKGRFDLLG